MLEQAIKQQLKEHFKLLDKTITLRVYKSEQPSYQELTDLLRDVANLSEKIEFVEIGSSNKEIRFDILAQNKDTGIIFRAIPSGHEFSTLILAILNASGKGKMPDPQLSSKISSLNGKIHLTSYISLSCEVCPDVMQKINQITLLNENMTHTIVDGSLYPEEVSMLEIQGVPAIFSEGKLIHSGKANLGEILDKLVSSYGLNILENHKKTVRHYDIAVIGGGPAGATSAIYSARKGLKVAMITAKMGGQVEETKGIENIIALDYVESKELSADLERRVRSHQVEIFEHRKVETIEGDEHKVLKLADGDTLTADSVIVATGAKWRELNISGEKEYLGRGVAYCPHCDGPYFKGKDVVVVGGGNSGVEAAIDLAGIVKSVTLLEFASELKADQVLQNRLQGLSNVQVLTQVKIEEITGDGNKVVSFTFTDLKSGEKRSKIIDGIFVQIGLTPNSEFVQGVLELNQFGEIVIDDKCRTSIPGVYAAGDVTTTPYKQIVTSMGEGAKAALAAFEDNMRKTIKGDFKAS
ncbi:MAG: alkyl hydroperoxide reductase subunit F [Oligoflexales bacterium]